MTAAGVMESDVKLVTLVGEQTQVQFTGTTYTESFTAWARQSSRSIGTHTIQD